MYRNIEFFIYMDYENTYKVYTKYYFSMSN